MKTTASNSGTKQAFVYNQETSASLTVKLKAKQRGKPGITVHHTLSTLTTPLSL